MATLDDVSQRGSVLDLGINTLLEESGVAKASLYAHFGSKEQLIVAWLERRQEAWFGWFDAHVEKHARHGDPASEIDAAFGFLEAWLSRDDFAGCPFITVYVQLQNEEHPAALESRRYAERLHAYFFERLRRMKRPTGRAKEEAAALLDLYLGAVVVGQLGVAGSRAATAARRTARAILSDVL